MTWLFNWITDKEEYSPTLVNKNYTFPNPSKMGLTQNELLYGAHYLSSFSMYL